MLKATSLARRSTHVKRSRSQFYPNMRVLQSIATYSDLLEKSRIARQQPEERNYHMFYQLLAGAGPELRGQLKLHPAAEFHYLNQSGCIEIKGVDDVKHFNRTKRAMGVVGIDTKVQEEIFKLLAAVLHLGNLEYAAKGDGIYSYM